jgi:integrase
MYNDIITFFESRTPNTRIAYEKDIRDFFKIMKNKDVEHVTEEDFKIKLSDIERFRLILKDNGYANTTINRRITAIRKLLKYLKANDYDFIKNDFFSEMDDLPENPESAGTLTYDEACQMAELALTERQQGRIKRLVILSAMKTSIRLEALVGIKWSDIHKKDDIYIINTIDKGNVHVKRPITKKFYNELLSIKTEGSDRVFNIYADTMQITIRRLCEKMGIPKERNITFHSLRAVGINFILDTTGDVRAAMRQSGHKSMDVFYKHYVDKSEDYSQMAGILMELNLDVSMFQNYSKEELVQVLLQCSRKTQNEALVNLNRLEFVVSE